MLEKYCIDIFCDFCPLCQKCIFFLIFLFIESRSSCGCGGGGSNGLTLPLLLGALFLATAFLNNQIIMAGGGRRRRKREIEDIFKPFLSEDTNESQMISVSSGRDYGGCGCSSDSSNLLPILLGALALAVFFLNMVRNFLNQFGKDFFRNFSFPFFSANYDGCWRWKTTEKTKFCSTK